MKAFGILGSIIIFAILLFYKLESKSESKDIELNQVQIDSLKRIECDSLLVKIRKKGTDKFGKVSNIPETIADSFTSLDSLINNDLKEWIRCLPDQEFGMYVHHSFGMYLRNNWGLWGGSLLANEFNKKGIYHPDDMSGIILDSYQRRLKGVEIKLPEQIQYYQDYWTRVDSTKKGK